MLSCFLWYIRFDSKHKHKHKLKMVDTDEGSQRARTIPLLIHSHSVSYFLTKNYKKSQLTVINVCQILKSKTLTPCA